MEKISFLQVMFLLQCRNGWAGDGTKDLCGPDPDQDGVVTIPLSCTAWGCRRVSNRREK